MSLSSLHAWIERFNKTQSESDINVHPKGITSYLSLILSIITLGMPELIKSVSITLKFSSGSYGFL